MRGVCFPGFWEGLGPLGIRGAVGDFAFMVSRLSGART